MLLKPCRSDTEIASRSTWRPSSFEAVVEELERLSEAAAASNELLLYRGHKDARWLLDSTFVRSFKTTLFGVEAHKRLSRRIVQSAEFHPALLNLYLLKFGVLTRPSDELEAVATEHSLDSWFEFMKRIQQYPEEDGFFLRGTNLMDWSLSSDIALYFANTGRAREGAVFVCNATATGNTLQTVPVGEILDRMNKAGNSGQALGPPLLFSPKRQISNLRPKNQQAAYFAQMDLRYDLEQMWHICENHYGRDIFAKIVLSKETIEPLGRYLAQKGIDDSFVFPDRNGPGA